MMARNLIGRDEDDQPSALLIAPTTSLVSKIAYQKDAALRVKQPSPRRRRLQATTTTTTDGNHDNDQNHRVYKNYVVHGCYDNAFCPNQDRWEEEAPSSAVVKLEILRDNHVFLSRSSIEKLTSIVDNLVMQAQTTTSAEEDAS